MTTQTNKSTRTTQKKSAPLAAATSGELQPSHDLVEYLKAYARERPEVAALWCFGAGFIVGWKLKLW